MIKFLILTTAICTLTLLDKKQVISVNNNTLKIIVAIYLIKEGVAGVNEILESTLLKP